MLSLWYFCPGARCFLAQMNVQRAELLERLSTAHNFCNLDDEDNYIAASKAVRQVGGIFEIDYYFFLYVNCFSDSVVLSCLIAGHPSAQTVGHSVARCPSSQHLL